MFYQNQENYHSFIREPRKTWTNAPVVTQIAQRSGNEMYRNKNMFKKKSYLQLCSKNLQVFSTRENTPEMNKPISCIPLHSHRQLNNNKNSGKLHHKDPSLPKWLFPSQEGSLTSIQTQRVLIDDQADY